MGMSKDGALGIVAVAWATLVGALLWIVAAVAAAFDGPEPTMRVFWLYAVGFAAGIVGVVRLWQERPDGRFILLGAGLFMVLGVALVAVALGWPRGAPLGLGGAGFVLAGLVGGRRGGA